MRNRNTSQATGAIIEKLIMAIIEMEDGEVVFLPTSTQKAVITKPKSSIWRNAKRVFLASIKGILTTS
jgi:hypothetical protein